MIEFKTFVQTRAFYQYLRKQKENQKFFRSLEIGATFGLISIFLFFALLPTFSTISSLIGEIKSKEALKEKLRSKINLIIQAQDNYAKIQDKYPIIESSLPDRPKYFLASNQVKLLSEQSSVTLDKISFNIAENKNDNANPLLQEYSINTKSTSNFAGIIDFISKSLNGRRIAEPVSFKFSPPIETNKNSTSSADYNINLNYSTNLFFWKNQSEKK